MPFRDVIGHRKLVALLARSVEHASVPPSLIFAGPEGVGKRLLAIATAQALNCLDPRRPVSTPRANQKDELQYDACGTCASCSRIARGVHPDVVIVEPGETGSIKVEVVRDIIDRAAYRPFEGRRRVVIIDHAEALVAAAQNALLKTLEEPPSASMFILVTAQPDALLLTVQSRCPRLRFQALGPDDVAAVLVKEGWNETKARDAAAMAEGSVGQALGADADELAETRDVAVRVLQQAAEVDDPRRRIATATDLLKNTGAGGASDREQLAMHLRAVASLLRDIELRSVHADQHALANPGAEQALERLSTFGGERGVRAFAAIDEALEALKGNAGVKIVADWVVLQL